MKLLSICIQIGNNIVPDFNFAYPKSKASGNNINNIIKNPYWTWIIANKIADIKTAPWPPRNDFSNPLNKNPRNKNSSKIGPKKTTPK